MYSWGHHDFIGVPTDTTSADQLSSSNVCYSLSYWLQDQINWHALNLKLWTYTEVKQIFEAIVFSHQQILMIQDRSERLKANLPKSGWKHLNTWPTAKLVITHIFEYHRFWLDWSELLIHTWHIVRKGIETSDQSSVLARSTDQNFQWSPPRLSIVPPQQA